MTGQITPKKQAGQKTSLDFTDPEWVQNVAAWHDNEAIGCRRVNGQSSPELADMHETTAKMLRDLLAKVENRAR